ncbi:helix-turn-helix transcriptional regulator [Streptomyces sp. NPDC059718]
MFPEAGYLLDKAMTLPPLNFTPGEAVAVAVVLSHADQTPFARDARSALRKLMAAMPVTAAQQAHGLAASVRLLLPPAASSVKTVIAEAVRQAVQQHRVVRITYTDSGGEQTVREVEPQLLVAGPKGWYLTGWCRLRQDTRAFRLDRVLSATLTSEVLSDRDPVPDLSVPGLTARTPVWE